MLGTESVGLGVDLERSTPLASPRLSLQERLWQVQEARPQQEHQDAPEPAALPSTPVRGFPAPISAAFFQFY